MASTWSSPTGEHPGGTRGRVGPGSGRMRPTSAVRFIGQQILSNTASLIIVQASVITVTCLGFNFLGGPLRDALDSTAWGKH